MTSIGERIYDLRNRNNMSQGNLADKLDVSRQTISKWENNMCLPEAEKLLQLSEIFGVSIDYILKGKTIVEPEPVYIYVKDPDSENVSKHNERIVRKYVGIVLAIIFGIISIVLLILGGYVLTVIPFAVAVLGMLLAKDIRHPWLITSWITYITGVLSLPFFTSINPFMIFDPIIYTEGYTIHLLWAWGIWTVLAILILC
ncbi:MAG: helix-turn-helix transcriptional regulator, partial [Clostridia bacterium]|nr:helix-turn-helix transcriptional regulator [Clostridia bacterium]